jgi:hypothetical protein
VKHCTVDHPARLCIANENSIVLSPDRFEATPESADGGEQMRAGAIMLAAEGADATGYPKRTRSVSHIAGEGEQRASGAARGDGRAERVMAAGEWQVGVRSHRVRKTNFHLCRLGGKQRRPTALSLGSRGELRALDVVPMARDWRTLRTMEHLDRP